MRKLDLDYAVAAQPYPLWIRLGLMLSAIALIVMTVLCYQLMQQELVQQQAALSANDAVQQRQAERPQSDEVIAYATKTQRRLNYPWLQLFSDLEGVKQQHATINLLNIVPNKAKSEMRLEGEAKSFNDITRLLNDLKSHEAFEDAVLVNQYLVEPDSPSENNGQPLYTFKLLLNWRAR